MPSPGSRYILFWMPVALISIEGWTAGRARETATVEEIDENRVGFLSFGKASTAGLRSSNDEAPPASGAPEPDVNARLEDFLAGLHPPTIEQIIVSIEPIPSLEEVLAPVPGDAEPPDGGATTVQDRDQTRAKKLEDEIQKLREQARYPEALPLAETLVELRRKTHGHDWWETVDAVHLAATIKRVAALPVEAQAELAKVDSAESQVEDCFLYGRYDEALRLVRWQLATRRRLLGHEHPEVAVTLNNLAVMLEQRAEYDGALTLSWESLVSHRRFLGNEHPEVAQSLNELAVVLFRKGDYGAAGLLYREALSVRRRLLGDEHSMVADVLNNLAVLLESQGDYRRAESLYFKALAIRRAIYGHEHYSVAEALSNLGLIFHLKGDYPQAELLYRQALDTRRKLLGDEHPDVAVSLNNLAGLMQAKGDYGAAEDLFREALNIWQSVFPNGHPMVAAGLSNLASVLKLHGKYVAAELRFREALLMRREFLGGAHPHVADTLNNLASLLHDKGDLSAAEPLYRESLAIYRRAHGAEHPNVATAQNNVALLLKDRGDYSAAEVACREALSTRRRLLGNAHPNVALNLSTLAVILQDRGQSAVAEPFCREALKIYRDVYGGDHPYVASTLDILASLLVDQGDDAAAESRSREALAIYHKVGGFAPRHVVVSLNRLAAFAVQKGEYAEAERFYHQALTLAETHRSRIIGAESARAAFAGQLELPDTAAGLADVLARIGRYDEAVEILERGRARGVLDLLARSSRDLAEEVRAGEDRDLSAALQRALENEAEARTALQTAEASLHATRQRRDLADEEQKREIETRQKAVRLRRRHLDDAEARALTVLAHVWPDAQPATIHQIRATLKKRDLILEFSWRGNMVTVYPVPPAGSEEVMRFVLAEGPGAVEELNQLVARVRAAISRMPSSDYDRSASTRLRRELLERLLPAKTRAQVLSAARVVVIPDGPLRDIPLESLMVTALESSAADAVRANPLLMFGPQVVYADSGTVYINRVKERQRRLSQADRPRLSALVLGDPMFRCATHEPAVPEHGIFITGIVEGSNADGAGLQRGDVMVGYDTKDVLNYDSLRSRIQEVNRRISAGDRREDAPVPVTFWRDDAIHKTTVLPGRMGLNVSLASPAESVRLRAMTSRGLEEEMARISNLDQVRLFGGELPLLPGTRREAETVARAIRRAGGTVELLLGEDATTGNLEARVQGKQYLLLATHGLAGSEDRPGHAALALTQPSVPTPDDIGFLTLDHLIRRWRGKLESCELVVLSACNTQRGIRKGDSDLALPWGFMYAGAPTVMASLWKVEDTATTLLVGRFFENMLGQYSESRGTFAAGERMPTAAALREAKVWLRSLPPREAKHVLRRGGYGDAELERIDESHGLDFSHPYFWAGFVLIGAPE